MSSNSRESAPGLEIPYAALSADALDAVIESFVLREGTDYGPVEASLDAKLKQVREGIVKRNIKIVYDPDSDSISLMTLAEWREACAKGDDKNATMVAAAPPQRGRGDKCTSEAEGAATDSRSKGADRAVCEHGDDVVSGDLDF